jgi:hypothetical protein
MLTDQFLDSSKMQAKLEQQMIYQDLFHSMVMTLTKIIKNLEELQVELLMLHQVAKKEP